ncbi:hypothetical protein MKX01_009278 [Papaver californicum]|nr:hypothetical protein MKX01_009278 [Papaver californicum]
MEKKCGIQLRQGKSYQILSVSRNGIELSRIVGKVRNLLLQYPMNITRKDVASLWFLCKQEASLLDITEQACGLFTPPENSCRLIFAKEGH